MNPILLDFPARIETDRLYLRPCLPGDGKLVMESIQHSVQELKDWMPFANKQPSYEEIEENIRRSYAKFILREDIRLHIFLKETDTFIGSTGLHKINWDVRIFEIGYWCDSRYAGNGYITESTKSLVQFAQDILKANRIEIRCDPLNFKSRNIPEKLGFKLEGIQRKDCKSADGKTLRGTCVFALT